MKTKPHQLRGNSRNSTGEAESLNHTTSFSDQKPKGANLVGNLRKAWPSSNLVIDPKTKGCHLPSRKVATFEKSGILSILSQNQGHPRYCFKNKRGSGDHDPLRKFSLIPFEVPPAYLPVSCSI